MTLSSLTSSRAWSQETRSAEEVVSKRLKKGQPAPDDGRWLKEHYFALWWHDYQRLAAQERVLSEEVERLVLDKQRLGAQANTAILRADNAELRLTQEVARREAVEKVAKDLYTPGQTWRIAAASAGAGILLGVLVVVLVTE